MSKQLIQADPTRVKSTEGIDKDRSLKVSEYFFDTIQGEGVSTGVPAAFLRLTDCTLDCVFCDSSSVWKYGNLYSFDELFQMMEESGLVEQLQHGVHLVLTGGSPLRQQKQLVDFLIEFYDKYEFLPFIEIENEGTLVPSEDMINLVSQWNNSPKLENSENKKKARYKPEIIKQLSQLDNSWFKFVISEEANWNEIEEDYLKPGLIKREQIILMPEGENQARLNLTREMAASIAIREGVRFSDRLHVTIWDKKTGI